MFGAFDDENEVMILQEIDSEQDASRWIDHPDSVAEWMAGAGVGAYPPIFVGRLKHMLRYRLERLSSSHVRLSVQGVSPARQWPTPVAAGATTTKQVAKACGAGTECGRCKHTIRAIIDAAAPPEAKRRRGFLHRG